MISFCIPVFNEDVTKLTDDLLCQCDVLSLNEYEIICIDDSSTDQHLKTNNRIKLNDKNHVQYSELPENIGRAAIRNLLISKVRAEFVVFLDGDACINHSFVQNYIDFKNEASVIYGGRKTSDEAPSNEFLLRWKYSKVFEEKSKEERQANEWINFKTNNFAIHKNVMEKVKFDEELKNYGHEDTLFALQLKEKGIGILHIENEVVHQGLDRNDIFLKHSKQGLENLLKLKVAGKIYGIKLMDYHKKIIDLQLGGILSLIAKKYIKLIEFKLISNPRNINLFQLWKLLFFHTLYCKK